MPILFLHLKSKTWDRGRKRKDNKWDKFKSGQKFMRRKRGRKRKDNKWDKLKTYKDKFCVVSQLIKYISEGPIE